MDVVIDFLRAGPIGEIPGTRRNQITQGLQALSLTILLQRGEIIKDVCHRCLYSRDSLVRWQIERLSTAGSGLLQDRYDLLDHPLGVFVGHLAGSGCYMTTPTVGKHEFADICGAPLVEN